MQNKILLLTVTAALVCSCTPVRTVYDANGNEVKAPNGMYKEADGSIHIDLNAGDAGQGTTLFTLAHELTHFIKQWNSKKFKVLADFLIEEYGKTDMSMHERVLA
jgi:Zn-dependent peptidase ImmA (M78 family)